MQLDFLKDELASVQICKVAEEKDLIISHYLEWGSLARQLGEAMNWTLDELT